MTTIQDTLQSIQSYLDNNSTDYDNNTFQLTIIIAICLIITVLKRNISTPNITLNDTTSFFINIFNIFIHISIFSLHSQKTPLLNTTSTLKDNLTLLSSVANVGTANASVLLQSVFSFIQNTNNGNSNIYNILTTGIFVITHYLLSQTHNITEELNQYDHTVSLDPNNIYDLQQIELLKTYSLYSTFINIGNITSIYTLILNFVSSTSSRSNSKKNIYSILDTHLPEN